MTTASARPEATASRLSSDQVRHQLAKASFAVISYVTPAGQPRSSGVVYKMIGRRLCFATAVGSWKARHLTAGAAVAVTVPVRRGGIMSLFLPIPPATITFHGSALVHPAGSPQESALREQLSSLLPPERRTTSRIIEIEPVGQFLTYGLGVSLKQTLNPALSLARVPVG